MFNVANSSKVAALYLDTLDSNEALVKGNIKASATLRVIFSHVLRVKYKLACSICLVAVLLLAAANFCNPTKAFLSG